MKFKIRKLQISVMILTKMVSVIYAYVWFKKSRKFGQTTEADDKCKLIDRIG